MRHAADLPKETQPEDNRQNSGFVRAVIEKELARLRHVCAVKRQIKRNAFGRRWALACDDCAGPTEYWDEYQAKAQRDSTAAVEAAERALADFIAEHRAIMGEGWAGSDHGRLCWAPFLGGTPIQQHYCECPEGHQGNHCNSIGAWPQNVTNVYEWSALIESGGKEARS